jgi:hypothetical protein
MHVPPEEKRRAFYSWPMAMAALQPLARLHERSTEHMSPFSPTRLHEEREKRERVKGIEENWAGIEK